MIGTAELRLAIECCRTAFPGSTPSQPLAERVDWQRFLSLVRFHRVEGLAWRAISAGLLDVPATARDRLRTAASTIAATNLQASLECGALRSSFESAGLRLLFLKGLTVGALAYRNPAVKAAIDVDLLIDPADLPLATGLLREHGYCLLTPPDGGEVLDRWHKVAKESVWAKSAPPVQLDLHTRVADNEALVPGITAGSASQEVEIGGGLILPTLAPDELFAYLALHGASSAWFRLKWISDLGALLHDQSGRDIARLFARSQELGAGRAAGQALLLSDRLFGTLEGCKALRQSLLCDRATRKLFRIGLRLLTREPAEPTASTFGTLPIHWTQFLLLPGVSFKFSELVGQARRMFAHRAANARSRPAS